MQSSNPKNWGLKQNTVDAVNRVFSQYPQIQKVIIYGSRAKGTFRTGSDIDLTIESDSLTLSQLLKIEIELDELLLPYKIDLSLLSAIESPDLVEHINRVGVVFYQARSDKNH